MSELNRRQFVKLSGTGAGLAFSAGVTGAQQREPGTEQEIEAEFDATINEGTLTLDGGSLGDPGAGLSISISELDGNIELDGEIYNDKTWTTNNIDFPDVDPAQFVDEDELPDIVESVEFDDTTQVDVVVDSISGVYDPAAGDGGLVTGTADMLIDAFIEGTAVLNSDLIDTYDFTLEFEIDLNEGDPIELTTGESYNLTGNAANLDTVNAEATVVNNNFTVPEATGPKTCIDPPVIEGVCVNDFLGLPITNPQRNWIELNLEPNWLDDPPQFGPPALPGFGDPPQDNDDDGLFEDITGSGDVGVGDTQALFNNLDSEAVQNNAGSFDFNSATPSDQVTILDVASHWRQNVFGG